MVTTLEALTDLITAQQREISDIEVLLSNQNQTITDHSSAIGTLQNPPAGVPPELLQWLDTHGLSEVDTQLKDDLTTHTTNISINATAIAQLQTDLLTEVANRSSADSDLSVSISDLQSQVTDNTNTINQEITDRSALSVTVSEGYDTINSRIDNLESDLSAQSSSSSIENSSLSSQLASTNAALQIAQTQILLLQGTGVDPLGAQASQITALTVIANDAATAVAVETNNRIAADNILQTAVNTLNSSTTGIQDSVMDEQSARIAKDSDLASDIAALTAAISGHAGLISAETASRIAADNVLTADVADNTTDITDLFTDVSDEVTNRSTADTTLQGNIDINSAAITAHAGQIATNTTDITTVKGKYGVVKDGGGYITTWWINDSSSSPGDFKLRNVNNDARLQNPSYVGKFLTPVSMIAVTLPATYDTDWGGATANDFHGTDGFDYTRNVKVYYTLTIGDNASCFRGNDNSTGGSLQRLGQVATTFKLDYSGVVNRYLSLWYRIKNTVADNSQRWFPAAYADNTMAGARTYEYTRNQAIVTISVPVDKVVEFGMTSLNPLDASIASAANDNIYGGSFSVTALNMTTIS